MERRRIFRTISNNDTIIKNMNNINQLQQRLAEAFLDLEDRYVDPYEPFHDDGERWMTAGGMIGLTETGLRTVRDECRSLALSNEFAINALENRINYVVGQGHRYHVVAKNDGDDDVADVTHSTVSFSLDLP